MSENRRQILELLAAGKITTSDAEHLLAAIEPVPHDSNSWLRDFLTSSLQTIDEALQHSYSAVMNPSGESK